MRRSSLNDGTLRPCSCRSPRPAVVDVGPPGARAPLAINPPGSGRSRPRRPHGHHHQSKVSDTDLAARVLAPEATTKVHRHAPAAWVRAATRPHVPHAGTQTQAETAQSPPGPVASAARSRSSRWPRSSQVQADANAAISSTRAGRRRQTTKLSVSRYSSACQATTRTLALWSHTRLAKMRSPSPEAQHRAGQSGDRSAASPAGRQSCWQVGVAPACTAFQRHAPAAGRCRK